MLDELDERIQRALRDDVAALPFTLTTAMVEERIGRYPMRLRFAIAGGLAAAVVVLVGAFLLSALLAPRQPVGPPGPNTPTPSASPSLPFGAAHPCGPDASFNGDAILRVELQDRGIVLGSDGQLVVIQPPHAVRKATYTRQRLTSSGISKVVDRVKAAGISAGCRELYAQIGQAFVQLWTDGELSDLTLTTSAVRVATPQEELALTSLFVDLHDPAGWLAPADMVDPTPGEFIPQTWQLNVDKLENSQAGGGDAALVWLPGGATLGTWGDAVSVDVQGPGVQRCATLSYADADRVATSLGGAGAFLLPGTDSQWLVSGSGNVDYQVGLAPMLPGALNCQAYGAFRNAMGSSPTSTQPLPEGDLVSVDACQLLPTSWYPAEVDTGLLPDAPDFQLKSYSCQAEVPSEDDWGPMAMVTVRGATTSPEEAESWVRGVFGEQGPQEQELGSKTVWFNACAVGNLDCTAAAAVLDGPYFYVFEYAAGAGTDSLGALRDLVDRAEISPPA